MQKSKMRNLDLIRDLKQISKIRYLMKEDK